MQPQVWPVACFLFSFEVKKGGTSKFIHHHCHHPTHKIPRVSGSDKAWVTPNSVLPVFLGLLSHQEAPQALLTKATLQGAPESGEAVLHPTRTVDTRPRCSQFGQF